MSLIPSTSWIRIKQILTVFLAGILIFVTTACNGSTQATSPRMGTSDGVEASDTPKFPEKVGKPAEEVREDMPASALTQPYEGGMNKYSDTDPRRESTTPGKKAQILQENAEEKTIDMTGNVVENTRNTLERKAENLERSGRNQRQSLENAQELFTGTAEKAQENVQEAAEATSQKSQEAAEVAKQTAQGLAEQAQREAEAIAR